MAVITHRVMVVPFLELRNTERSGVDGKMIIEFPLPRSYFNGKGYHEEENRAPYDSRSLFMYVINFLDMAKYIFPIPNKSHLSYSLIYFFLSSPTPHTTHVHTLSLNRFCQQYIYMFSSSTHRKLLEYGFL